MKSKVMILQSMRLDSEQAMILVVSYASLSIWILMMCQASHTYPYGKKMYQIQEKFQLVFGQIRNAHLYWE